MANLKDSNGVYPFTKPYKNAPLNIVITQLVEEPLVFNLKLNDSQGATKTFENFQLKETSELETGISVTRMDEGSWKIWSISIDQSINIVEAQLY